MLNRLGWACVNSGLWLATGASGIVAALSDTPLVRVAAVVSAMSLTAGWTAHSMADHYGEIIDENEMHATRRHVVFGATEEADHALAVQLSRASRSLRAHRRRIRRRRPDRLVPAHRWPDAAEVRI